jgi:hypothetical protein
VPTIDPWFSVILLAGGKFIRALLRKVESEKRLLTNSINVTAIH